MGLHENQFDSNEDSSDLSSFLIAPTGIAIEDFAQLSAPRNDTLVLKLKSGYFDADFNTSYLQKLIATVDEVAEEKPRIIVDATLSVDQTSLLSICYLLAKTRTEPNNKLELILPDNREVPKDLPPRIVTTSHLGNLPHETRELLTQHEVGVLENAQELIESRKPKPAWTIGPDVISFKKEDVPSPREWQEELNELSCCIRYSQDPVVFKIMNPHVGTQIYAELGKLLKGAISNDTRNFIVDLSAIDTISGGAIGMLVARHKQAHAKSVSFSLVVKQDSPVASVLARMNLDRLFDISYA